jgi:hypothetical protein
MDEFTNPCIEIYFLFERKKKMSAEHIFPLKADSVLKPTGNGENQTIIQLLFAFHFKRQVFIEF